MIWIESALRGRQKLNRNHSLPGTGSITTPGMRNASRVVSAGFSGRSRRIGFGLNSITADESRPGLTLHWK
jgi:hypothetical protein